MTKICARDYDWRAVGYFNIWKPVFHRIVKGRVLGVARSLMTALYCKFTAKYSKILKIGQ